jgi:transposase
MTPTCVEQLPDDPAVLKRLVIEHQAALVGRQLQIERVEREAAAALAARDAAVAERDAQIERIRHEAAGQIEAMRQRHQAEMDALLRRFYGPRNERFDPTQILLFGREIDRMPLDVRAVEQEAGQKLLTRRARNRHNHGRAALPLHLPREVVKHELKEDERFGADGKPLVCIGYEVSEQLGYRPGGLFVLEHRRFKYAPADYQQSDTGATIVIADKPPQPIEKGLAAPCLLAHVITSKLADHPFATLRAGSAAVPPGADLRPPGRSRGPEHDVRLDPGRRGTGDAAGAADEEARQAVQVHPLRRDARAGAVGLDR